MKLKLMIVIASLAMLSACGATGEDSQSSSTVQSPSTTVSVTSPPTTVATTTTTLPPTTTTAAPLMSSSKKGIMPSVVGMNLQDAQDLIQSSAGVFYSRSYDCSGRNRSQIVDSNWVVVRQTPTAGSPISEGSANLGVVKYGEARVC